jgi:hypothetical protein
MPNLVTHPIGKGHIQPNNHQSSNLETPKTPNITIPQHTTTKWQHESSPEISPISAFDKLSPPVSQSKSPSSRILSPLISTDTRTKSPSKVKHPYDALVDNAINSQDTVHQLDDTVHHSSADSHSITESPSAPAEPEAVEEQRQWQWAVAEEMMVDSKEARTSQILDEVGRMEVWMDSVGDRVKTVKGKLDDMEEEGGVVLNLKDANTK